MKKRNIATAAAAAALLCASCTRTVYLPVETVSVKTDTLRLVTLRSDTLRLSDTLILRQQGDTVIHEQIHWRERLSTRTDTLWRVRTDTLTVIKTIQPETSSDISGCRKESWWQRFGSGLKDSLLALLLLAGAALVTIRFLRRGR